MIGEDARLVEHRNPRDEMEPYERLLGDAMRGDRTLFGSEAEVEAAWRVVDPILHPDGPLCEYDCGSCGPADTGRIAAHIGGWIEPNIAGASPDTQGAMYQSEQRERSGTWRSPSVDAMAPDVRPCRPTPTAWPTRSASQWKMCP